MTANTKRGLPPLALHAAQRLHSHGHHHRAVRLVLPLQRHRDEVDAHRPVRVAHELSWRTARSPSGSARGGATASVLATTLGGLALVIVMDCTAGTAFR